MAAACSETDLLLKCSRDEERRKLLAEFFIQYRDRLKLMVQLRLFEPLKGRVDPSDVVQDAYVEAMQRLGAYLAERPMPLFAWLRRLTGQKLIDCVRMHVGAQIRDVRRERSIDQDPMPHTTAVGLANCLAYGGPTPSEAAIRAERMQQVREALERMEPLDRDVLALRHFEHLSNTEIALELGIDQSTASRRYLRALQALKRAVAGASGEVEER